MRFLVLFSVAQTAVVAVAWTAYEATGSVIVGVAVSLLSLASSRVLVGRWWSTLGDPSGRVDDPGWLGHFPTVETGGIWDATAVELGARLTPLVALGVWLTVIEGVGADIHSLAATIVGAPALTFSGVAEGLISARRAASRVAAAKALEEDVGELAVTTAQFSHGTVTVGIRRWRVAATALAAVILIWGFAAFLLGRGLDQEGIESLLFGGTSVAVGGFGLYVGRSWVRILLAPVFVRITAEGMDPLGAGLIPWSAIADVRLIHHNGGRCLYVRFKDLPLDGGDAGPDSEAIEHARMAWRTAGHRRLANEWGGSAVCVAVAYADVDPRCLMATIQSAWGRPLDIEP